MVEPTGASSCVKNAVEPVVEEVHDQSGLFGDGVSEPLGVPGGVAVLEGVLLGVGLMVGDTLREGVHEAVDDTEAPADSDVVAVPVGVTGMLALPEWDAVVLALGVSEGGSCTRRTLSSAGPLEPLASPLAKRSSVDAA